MSFKIWIGLFAVEPVLAGCSLCVSRLKQETFLSQVPLCNTRHDWLGGCLHPAVIDRVSSMNNCGQNGQHDQAPDRARGAISRARALADAARHVRVDYARQTERTASTRAPTREAAHMMLPEANLGDTRQSADLLAAAFSQSGSCSLSAECQGLRSPQSEAGWAAAETCLAAAQWPAIAPHHLRELAAPRQTSLTKPLRVTDRSTQVGTCDKLCTLPLLTSSQCSCQLEHVPDENSAEPPDSALDPEGTGACTELLGCCNALQHAGPACTDTDRVEALMQTLTFLRSHQVGSNQNNTSWCCVLSAEPNECNVCSI